MQEHLTNFEEKIQYVELSDIRKSGKKNDWQGKKKSNLLYFDILHELDFKKASNVKLCAEVLTFERTETGQLKLKNSWFCKSRLCPMCNWRKSLKHSNQVIKIINKIIEREPKGRFLFWTLTSKNCKTAEELKTELTKMNKAFAFLLKYKKINQNLLGFLKAVEVTVNPKDGSYNQHIHVLVFVKSSYFKNKENYISQKELTDFWQKAMRLDYRPIVNVKAVKPASETEKGIIGAVYETAKYPVKSVDYLTGSPEENKKRVTDLEKALKNKRIISYGGIFKDVKNELALEDIEKANLISTDSEEEHEPTTGEIILAKWNWQRQNYFLQN